MIGGYESGVDVVYHLSYHDKRVLVRQMSLERGKFRSQCRAVDVFARTMREDWFEDQVELFPNTWVASVSKVETGYEVETKDGRTFQTSTEPLLAGGFEGSHKIVSHLFEHRDDGLPLLSENDESTRTSGIYLCGLTVRHDNQSLFITSIGNACRCEGIGLLDCLRDLESYCRCMIG